MPFLPLVSLHVPSVSCLFAFSLLLPSPCSIYLCCSHFFTSALMFLLSLPSLIPLASAFISLLAPVVSWPLLSPRSFLVYYCINPDVLEALSCSFLFCLLPIVMSYVPLLLSSFFYSFLLSCSILYVAFYLICHSFCCLFTFSIFIYSPCSPFLTCVFLVYIYLVISLPPSYCLLALFVFCHLVYCASLLFLTSIRSSPIPWLPRVLLLTSPAFISFLSYYSCIFASLSLFLSLSLAIFSLSFILASFLILIAYSPCLPTFPSFMLLYSFLYFFPCCLLSLALPLTTSFAFVFFSSLFFFRSFTAYLLLLLACFATSLVFFHLFSFMLSHLSCLLFLVIVMMHCLFLLSSRLRFFSVLLYSSFIYSLPCFLAAVLCLCLASLVLLLLLLLCSPFKYLLSCLLVIYFLS